MVMGNHAMVSIKHIKTTHLIHRMDICRWNVFTSMESISFQWIIIVMLYLTTIVLSLSAESMDGGMYMNKQNATAWEHGVVRINIVYYISYILYLYCVLCIL